MIRDHPELDFFGVWEFLGEVAAPDPLTVTFTFQHTFVPGFEYLAHLPIVPHHIWEGVEDPLAFTNPEPVATGPFTQVLHFDDTVWELGRNPHYWQEGKPAVSRLRFPIYSSNDEVVSALKAGELDWTGNFIPNVEEEYVSLDPEHHISWSPLIGGPVFLYLNTTVVPFDRVEVRKALSMAIDRQELVEIAMQGMTRQANATGLGDGNKQYYSQDAIERGTWVQLDPQAAEAALDAAGFPRGTDGRRGPRGGEPFSFEIIVPSGWSDWVVATRLIADQLNQAGVAVTVNPIPHPEWWDKVLRGEFDLSMGFITIGATPYGSYRWLMSTASVLPVGERATSNWHRFGDEQATALIEAIEMTREEDVQKELFHQLQLRFVELAPAIPLFLGPVWGTCNSTRFEGFPSADNPYIPLSPNSQPSCIKVLTELRPR